MSIHNFEIDESLKMKLNLLLNEFNSYRVSNMELVLPVQELTQTQKIEIKEKKNSFFKKFFFSDF